jgi:hypothetical protein
MITVFDFLAVACFCGLVIAFFQFTDRDVRSLLHLLVPGLAFALGNQIGNAGMPFLALVLMVAGAGYAVLVIQRA